MVFVTVGTQNFNFTRLLNAVEEAVKKDVIREKVIAQIGHNKFDSEYFTCIPFLKKEEFNKHISRARFVISHGGTGSLISALKLEKKIIVAPRLARYDEHIDDHQLEIIEVFTRQNLIIPLKEDLSDLEEKIKTIDSYNLNTYQSNTKKFNKNLINLIESL